jgi:hypothetical protein
MDQLPIDEERGWLIKYFFRIGLSNPIAKHAAIRSKLIIKTNTEIQLPVLA